MEDLNLGRYCSRLDRGPWVGSTSISTNCRELTMHFAKSNVLRAGSQEMHDRGDVEIETALNGVMAIGYEENCVRVLGPGSILAEKQ